MIQENIVQEQTEVKDSLNSETCLDGGGFDLKARPSIQPIESSLLENNQASNETEFLAEGMEVKATSSPLQKDEPTTSTSDVSNLSPLKPSPDENAKAFYLRVKNQISKREMAELVGKE